MVVLRVSSGGGFVTPKTNLRALPSFTLYGDGSVIVPGPVIQIYPGPALTPLVRSKLDEGAVQAVLARAKAAGLLAPRGIDYGGMGAVGVSDMPTTTLVVNAAGKRFKRQAYALGAPAQGGRLSPAQARARKTLQQFIAGLPARRVRRRFAATCGRRLRRALPRTGAARLGADRVAAGEQSRDGRQACLERSRLPLHQRRRRAREDAAGSAGQGQRAVALEGSCRREGDLRGGRPSLLPDERGCPPTVG